MFAAKLSKSPRRTRMSRWPKRTTSLMEPRDGSPGWKLVFDTDWPLVLSIFSWMIGETIDDKVWAGTGIEHGDDRFQEGVLLFHGKAYLLVGNLEEGYGVLAVDWRFNVEYVRGQHWGSIAGFLKAGIVSDVNESRVSHLWRVQRLTTQKLSW